MPKYLKIPPDPDAPACHCGDGNPDCEHWEPCDGCGMDYRKAEGHDCIDHVHVEDIWTLAKELRDALDACETERDRLRAHLAALQSVPQGMELTDADLDAIYPEANNLGSYHHEIHRRRLRAVIALAFSRRCLVPTPPHPLQPLQPEERRVGPDEVVVGREEWGCMLDLVLCLLIDEDAYDKAEKFLDPIEQVRKARDGNGWIGVMADELDALRTSAQTHNGEGAK
jgi:hypothetical protein